MKDGDTILVNTAVHDLNYIDMLLTTPLEQLKQNPDFIKDQVEASQIDEKNQ